MRERLRGGCLCAGGGGEAPARRAGTPGGLHTAPSRVWASKVKGELPFTCKARSHAETDKAAGPSSKTDSLGHWAQVTAGGDAVM